MVAKNRKKSVTRTNRNGVRATTARFRALSEPQQVDAIRELSAVLIDRFRLMRQAGITFDGDRDLYAVLGYQRVLDNNDFRDRYERGGIAGSVIDVFPDATWRGVPAFNLVEDENSTNETEFETAWEKIEQQHGIIAKLRRVDKLSLLSTYAVLLIGAPGDLETELPMGTPDSLLYLQPYSGGGGPGRDRRSDSKMLTSVEADAMIQTFQTNPHDRRFGLPQTYQLRRTDFYDPSFLRPVHHSRIIHCADGCLDNEVFGQPGLERVWNLLDDLEKVTGGGSEAFWLRANQGMHMDINKDMGLKNAEDQVAALKEQADAYRHQQTRWIRTRGVEITPLGSDVANFQNPADSILTQIAGAKRIPKRILTGSEMGELASSQDRDNWKDQILGRQQLYAGPYVVRPLIDRLIKYGYLPAPKAGPDEYEVVWPHMQTLTEVEKSDGAKSWAETTTGEGQVFTNDEIRNKWYAMAPLTKAQKDALKPALPPAPAPQPQLQPQPDDTARLQTAQARHTYGTVQIALPNELAGLILEFGQSIPDAELFLPEGGRELDPHITVCYGLKDTIDPGKMQALLSKGWTSGAAIVGRTRVFSSPEYDVIVFEVKSQDLTQLNEAIKKQLDVQNDYDTYVPHATVAYVKPGEGSKYADRTLLSGYTFKFDRVTMVSVDGTKTDVRIAQSRGEPVRG